MFVAWTIAPRNFTYWNDRDETPRHGLICKRCHAFFLSAKSFTKHGCWRLMQEQSRQEKLAVDHPKPVTSTTTNSGDRDHQQQMLFSNSADIG